MERGGQNSCCQSKIDVWAAELQACQASGQSVAQWCTDKGISPSVYYRRRRRVLEALEDTQSQELYEVPMERDSGVGTISIECNGLTAKIQGRADERMILAVVQAMKSC